MHSTCLCLHALYSWYCILVTVLLAMASSSSTTGGTSDVLATLTFQVRGIKFYKLREICVEVGSPVELQLDPTNEYDLNCVEILCGGMKLGHLQRQLTGYIAPFIRLQLDISG